MYVEKNAAMSGKLKLFANILVNYFVDIHIQTSNVNRSKFFVIIGKSLIFL